MAMVPYVPFSEMPFQQRWQHLKQVGRQVKERKQKEKHLTPFERSQLRKQQEIQSSNIQKDRAQKTKELRRMRRLHNAEADVEKSGYDLYNLEHEQKETNRKIIKRQKINNKAKANKPIVLDSGGESGDSSTDDDVELLTLGDRKKQLQQASVLKKRQHKALQKNLQSTEKADIIHPHRSHMEQYVNRAKYTNDHPVLEFFENEPEQIEQDSSDSDNDDTNGSRGSLLLQHFGPPVPRPIHRPPPRRIQPQLLFQGQTNVPLLTYQPAHGSRDNPIFLDD